MLRSALQKLHRMRIIALEHFGNILPLPEDKIRVHHGAVSWGIGGPAVKTQRMQKYFPDHPVRFNIIYTVSAKVSPKVCLDARKRGVKIVQHINSLYHPAYRTNYKKMNAPFRDIYTTADHIVFGSIFAKEAAEKYLGPCRAPHNIIYNSVDLSHFTPAEKPDNRFNILAIGGHYIRHRIEPLILAIPHVNRIYPEAKLLIVGKLTPGEGMYDCSRESFTGLAKKTGVLENIEFYPEYTQDEAPRMYALGDISVHLKHMDWTPNTVIESMACGVPVLHTGNGGLPETVGEGGTSLGLPNDWENIHSPDPELLARKIIQLYEMRKEKSELAREIAVRRYDLNTWIDSHREIFEGLFNGTSH